MGLGSVGVRCAGGLICMTCSNMSKRIKLAKLLRNEKKYENLVRGNRTTQKVKEQN
jgi:hypothetical protein